MLISKGTVKFIKFSMKNLQQLERIDWRRFCLSQKALSFGDHRSGRRMVKGGRMVCGGLSDDGIAY
jgi:hypothetical protein